MSALKSDLTPDQGLTQEGSELSFVLYVSYCSIVKSFKLIYCKIRAEDIRTIRILSDWGHDVSLRGGIWSTFQAPLDVVESAGCGVLG